MADRIEVATGKELPEVSAGDFVLITYDGTIQETYRMACVPESRTSITMAVNCAAGSAPSSVSSGSCGMSPGDTSPDGMGGTL